MNLNQYLEEENKSRKSYYFFNKKDINIENNNLKSHIKKSFVNAIDFFIFIDISLFLPILTYLAINYIFDNIAYYNPISGDIILSMFYFMCSLLFFNGILHILKYKIDPLNNLLSKGMTLLFTSIILFFLPYMITGGTFSSGYMHNW